MSEARQRPQDRWDAKTGLVTKGFKVKESVAKEFTELCKNQGVSMGPLITQMMQDYIDQHK
ncbi:MAG: hypothetical protein Q4B09_04980 [Lachnospiraceae bacterium]|nr:hypothetical protein [Lachnospiraceae bacterium]